jgi:hypothetical protein
MAVRRTQNTVPNWSSALRFMESQQTSGNPVIAVLNQQHASICLACCRHLAGKQDDV